MKALLMGLIHAYRLATSWAPSPCRYQPSCSAYGLEAIRSHGAARGSVLAMRRILSCHPWRPGGYDPVPPAAASTRR